MAALSPPICDFGWEAVDFDLEGVDGRRYTLADIRGDNGTLVIFMCNHCPFVKAVIDRIVADAKALEAEGIGAIASNSSRRASGTAAVRDSSKRPRYCSARAASKPKKSGVQMAS